MSPVTPDSGGAPVGLQGQGGAPLVSVREAALLDQSWGELAEGLWAGLVRVSLPGLRVPSPPRA